MAKFYINITKLPQLIYTVHEQSLTIGPGELVDADKLGYEPSVEQGFEPANLLQKLIKSEAGDSRVSLPSDTLDATIPHDLKTVSRSLASLPTAEILGASDIQTFQDNAPNLNAAIRALAEGRDFSSEYIPIPQNSPNGSNSYTPDPLNAPVTPRERLEILKGAAPSRSNSMIVDADLLQVEDDVIVPTRDPLLLWNPPEEQTPNSERPRFVEEELPPAGDTSTIIGTPVATEITFFQRTLDS